MKEPAEKVIKDIRRATRRRLSAEEKIRIVLEGLRGEESMASLCRREGIAESFRYNWSKEFLEAGKRQLPLSANVPFACRAMGDTTRSATSDEVKRLRGEARDLFQSTM